MEFEKQPVLELPKEMGFQSYELIAGEGEQRDVAKKAFMAGEVRNPTLDYPLLDDDELNRMIHQLEPVLDISQRFEDETLGEVVWNSASYRMAEMYWLLEAKRLNEAASINPRSDEFKLSAARYQEANEQLYDRPEHETTEKVYGEIIAQAGAKNLHPEVRGIYDQLINGVTVYLENTQAHMPGIGAEHHERLPQDVKEKLDELREVLEEEFSDAINIVNDYWANKVAVRDEENPGFEVDDMVHVFTKVRDFYDPENFAGITIRINPNSSGLAWDTPSMSIVIGGKRGKITNPSAMIAAVIHEYGVHGLRALNGKKSGVPALNSGMYSDAQPGERSDYLTFEEGFATLCGMSMDDDFADWSPMYLAYYFGISSAYEGCDFRQAYERMWRMAAVMDAKDDEPLSDKTLARLKRWAYTCCIRIFRGTPTQLAGGPVLTFNKDLAYLNGKLDALRYLDEHKGDRQAITRLFLGKFDPNNHIQNSIVERYVEGK